MHIAVLSDPNNFHTQKWATALMAAGADVTVFSFEPYAGDVLTAVQLPASARFGGRYTYFSYLRGGKTLRNALDAHGIDVVNALNVTPFGVWAMYAGKRPLVISALGADILEYPPAGEGSPLLDVRSWANVEGSQHWWQRLRHGVARKFFRRKVRQALQVADLVTGDNQYLVDCMRGWFAVPEAKLRLLRWGVEPELFAASPDKLAALRQKYGLPAGKPVIFSPRGAKAIYQGDIVVDAFARLLQDGRRDVHCIMLSAGYEISSETAQKARSLSHTHPNFIFIDQAIPREEVYALWNLVDVFISAPIYDGYSAAVAEGRYLGAVPVVNDIPANRELFEHGVNGWICAPFTPEQLHTDLQKVLENLPALKEKFASVNQVWIEKHSLVKDNAATFVAWAENLADS